MDTKRMINMDNKYVNMDKICVLMRIFQPFRTNDANYSLDKVDMTFKIYYACITKVLLTTNNFKILSGIIYCYKNKLHLPTFAVKEL